MGGQWHRGLERHWKVLLLVVMPLLSLGMHLHVFRYDLQGIHAWRQCETASNVLRFAEEGMDIFAPRVYSLEWEGGLKRMEFPVMQWVMAAAVRATGDEVLAMRGLSWLIGVLAVWGMFVLLDGLLRHRVAALLTAWAFQFSPLFFYYTMNPLPDNLALMAGIWSLAAYVRHVRVGGSGSGGAGGWGWLLLSAGMCGLAALAKLPFAVVAAVPAGHVLLGFLRAPGQAWRGLLLRGAAFALGLLPAACWYAWVIPTWHGNGIVKGILDSSASEVPAILDIFLHHLVSTLPELLLNYATVPLFLLGLWLAFARGARRSAWFWPGMLLAAGVMVYFVFEINMIGKAHDYYLFPFLPLLFVLVGLGLRRLVVDGRGWVGMALGLMLLVMPVTAAVRAYPRWMKVGFPEELVTQAEALRGAVPKEARVLAGHDLSPHIFLYHLRHQGWNLSKDDVDSARVQRCVAQGARYLYSSDRALDGHAAMQPFLGPMLKEVGTFRIYALKLP